MLLTFKEKLLAMIIMMMTSYSTTTFASSSNELTLPSPDGKANLSVLILERSAISDSERISYCDQLLEQAKKTDREIHYQLIVARQLTMLKNPQIRRAKEICREVQDSDRATTAEKELAKSYLDQIEVYQSQNPGSCILL